jgi:hypothetical protein
MVGQRWEEEYVREVAAMGNDGDPESEPRLLKALANSMNNRHEAPLSLGIVWSASESGKLVDLMVDEGTSAANGRRHGDIACASGSTAIKEEEATEEDPIGMEWFLHANPHHD